jgi:hypothetical protein
MTASRPRRPDIGDQPILFVDCTDSAGVATSPTAGRLLVAEPGAASSSVVEFASFDVAPGGLVGRVEYTMPAPLAVAGLWRVYWEFTAGVVGAEPYEFAVAARTVPDPA